MLLERTGPGSPYLNPTLRQLCNRGQSDLINLYQRLSGSGHHRGVLGECQQWSLDELVWSGIDGKPQTFAPMPTFYDPAARERLLDVARLYEVLIRSLEMLPPERPSAVEVAQLRGD